MNIEDKNPIKHNMIVNLFMNKLLLKIKLATCSIWLFLRTSLSNLHQSAPQQLKEHLKCHYHSIINKIIIIIFNFVF